MSQKGNAQLLRAFKLFVVASALVICLVGPAFLLNTILRLFAWGAAGGLIFTATAWLVGVYIRGGAPLDTSRAAIEAKARRSRALTTVAVVVAVLSVVVFRFSSYSAVLLGISAGIFIFFGLLISPLFYHS